MRTVVTEQMRNDIRHEIGRSIAEVKSRLLADMKPRLLGMVVEHSHTEEEEWGKFIYTPVEARVTNVEWTYEDELLMTVTYTHPQTGEVCVGTETL